MKIVLRHVSRALTLALYIFSLGSARGAGDRAELNLNSGWLFHFGETPGAETAGFNTAGWTPVTVPHTWNALDGQDGVKVPNASRAFLHGDYAQGTGWYRRQVKTDAAWAGRRVYLQFDAANRRTDVYLNGQLIGTHLGGFARFRFDLTDHLQAGGDNLLAVKVNNEENGIIPQQADFTFFGGIYRDVGLVVTDPVQIETMDHASPGVFLIQTNITAERADVQARVEVVNHESTPQTISVRVALTDASGKKAGEARGSLALGARAPGEVTISLQLDKPHLWNGRADPYLYSARVEVSTGNKVRDAVVQPLGLRFFRVDPNRGFFLNGKYLDLHGVSRHQDRLDKGWAIGAADEREDFALIKEMGCTAIRVAHYQQSPLWYRLADEQGLVQWAEIPFVDDALPTELFNDNAVDQMRELIRQNYNHPAICFWGCGNENFDAGVPFAAGIAKYGPLSEHLIQKLDEVAHAEDATRLTTYASFHSEDKMHIALPGQPVVDVQGEPQRWYTDLTAFNKYFGWYYGEPEDNAQFFDQLHARHPTQRIGVSEYGAGASILQHEGKAYGTPAVAPQAMRASAFGPVHPEEYQAYYHERAWKVLAARPYLWTKFVWTMFDFASDGRNEAGQPGRNDKGLVSYDRKTRKDAFYFYKASWSSDPVLYITSRRFQKRTEAITDIKVYSNSADVELFVNGRSVGHQQATDRIFVWKSVTLQPGENQIRVSAGGSKGALTDECSWILQSAPAATTP